MIENFLAKILMALLMLVFKRASLEVKTIQAKIDLEKERGETNAANTAKYEAAQTRADRVKAALDLLNGTPSK